MRAISTGVRSYVRPDGRCLVRPTGAWTREAAAEAVALAEELRLPALAHLDGDAIDDHDVLARAGFTASRTHAHVVVDVEVALATLGAADVPLGVETASAADANEDRLRLLDDELRADVPGTSGWTSTSEEFRAHTFDDPAFDPRTYLVAVDVSTGEYLGLVRVWMNPPVPRLGLVGTRREQRRRGIASALLRLALAAVHAAGEAEVVTEYDVENEASRAFFERLGARPSGTTTELVYEPEPAKSTEPFGVR